MQKVRIIALDESKDDVVAALHRMDALEIRKSKLELPDDTQQEYTTTVSDLLIRVNGALQLLPDNEVREEEQLKLNELIAHVKGLKAINTVYELAEERNAIKDDQNALNFAAHVSDAFSGIRIDFSKLKSNFLDYVAFEADGRAFSFFQKKRKEITGSYEVISRRLPKGRFLVFIAYDKKLNIGEIVKEKGVNEIDLSAKYLDSTPEKVSRNVRERMAKNERRLAEIAKELESISSKHYSNLVNFREMLEIYLQRGDISSSFKRTESTFVIEGWVWMKRVGELEDEIERVTNGRSYVEGIKTDELAPTYTRRPKFLEPFDYLVNFYSTQRSDELDPTLILIISFPIFYGLMVSDVGYGLVSLVFVTLLLRKYKEGLLYNALKIWQLTSISAIFFGVLSDQYFGLHLTSFQVFDWLKDAPQMIALTILFGVAQITVGLIFGVVNNMRRHHRKLAVSRLLAIFALLFGTVAVAGAFFGAFNSTITLYTGIIAIASIIGSAATAGIEATETLNLITHPLSYARIMGFGLGSVIIALLIDQAFTPHLSQGILLFVLYLAIFIVLHFLNMILAIFEGMVQGVRLNFVEFFSKFYIGNGIKFRPFGYKRIHTKE